MIYSTGEIVYQDGNYYDIRVIKRGDVYKAFTYFTRGRHNKVQAYASNKNESLAINELLKLIK